MRPQTDDEWIPKDGEETPEQTLGLDPNLSTRLCRCGAQLLDLGKETATKYTSEKRWYKCPGCNIMFSEITGAAKEAESYSCLHDLKCAGII
jgi:hypothetical protein